jgi:hypothetical protein
MMIPGMGAIMAGVVPLSGPRSGKIIDAVNTLGLTAGLKLCLDAGDINSYSSGQKWLDVSGNGYDFNRGASSSSQSSDPTFNGTPGNESSSEYWSLDGGDYFTYDSASETWMDALHQNNALFAYAGWMKLPTLSTTIFGTAGTGIGVNLEASASADTISLLVSRLPALAAFSETVTVPLPEGDVFIAARIDEAADTWSVLVNGTIVHGASCTYTSPASGVASNPMQIGATGGGASIARSGTGFHNHIMWQAAAPSLSDLMALYHFTRPRY